MQGRVGSRADVASAHKEHYLTLDDVRGAAAFLVVFWDIAQVLHGRPWQHQAVLAVGCRPLPAGFKPVICRPFCERRRKLP